METDSISDNQKETKNKRRTEDHKSKRKKQLEKTEIELSDNISKEPCVKQARLGNMHLVDTYKTEKPELIIVEDSKFRSSIDSVPGNCLHFIIFFKMFGGTVVIK